MWGCSGDVGFFSERVESMELRLALLAWPKRTAGEPMLVRLDGGASFASSWLCVGDMMERPEFLLARFGRMTWEAPFLYDKWMLSFAGEGGRRDC